MACGECKKDLDALRQRVVDLEAVLDELREEYLSLAKAYDDLVGNNDEDEEEV